MDSKLQAVVAAAAEVSEEAATRVAAAIDAITSEPPLGTVLRNASTGDVAVRVGQYGEFYWRVYATDDRTWIEPEPLVGWDVLHQETSAEAKPAEVAPAKTTKK